MIRASSARNSFAMRASALDESFLRMSLSGSFANPYIDAFPHATFMSLRTSSRHPVDARREQVAHSQPRYLAKNKAISGREHFSRSQPRKLAMSEPIFKRECCMSRYVTGRCREWGTECKVAAAVPTAETCQERAVFWTRRLRQDARSPLNSHFLTRFRRPRGCGMVRGRQLELL